MGEGGWGSGSEGFVALWLWGLGLWGFGAFGFFLSILTSPPGKDTRFGNIRLPTAETTAAGSGNPLPASFENISCGVELLGKLGFGYGVKVTSKAPHLGGFLLLLLAVITLGGSLSLKALAMARAWDSYDPGMCHVVVLCRSQCSQCSMWTWWSGLQPFVCMVVMMSGMASVKQLPSTRFEEASFGGMRGWRTQAFEWER
jgi:hypothetical protein